MNLLKKYLPRMWKARFFPLKKNPFKLELWQYPSVQFSATVAAIVADFQTLYPIIDGSNNAKDTVNITLTLVFVCILDISPYLIGGIWMKHTKITAKHSRVFILVLLTLWGLMMMLLFYLRLQNDSVAIFEKIKPSSNDEASITAHLSQLAGMKNRQQLFLALLCCLCPLLNSAMLFLMTIGGAEERQRISELHMYNMYLYEEQELLQEIRQIENIPDLTTLQNADEEKFSIEIELLHALLDKERDELKLTISKEMKSAEHTTHMFSKKI